MKSGWFSNILKQANPLYICNVIVKFMLHKYMIISNFPLSPDQWNSVSTYDWNSKVKLHQHVPSIILALIDIILSILLGMRRKEGKGKPLNKNGCFIHHLNNVSYQKKPQKTWLGLCPGKVILYCHITIQRKLRMNTEDLKRGDFVHSWKIKINTKTTTWAAVYSLVASKYKFKWFSLKITKVSFS